MKKLLALVLSMIMAVSLAVPAFADGPDGPPAEVDLGIIGGADGPTGVVISAPVDDGDFDWWSVEDEWEAVCEWYPEYTAIFLEEAEAWYAGHAAWYDAGTFDEFAEDVGGKEAAYLSLFYDWKWEREEELARNAIITSLGGVPGQIGVMVNGRYIQFPDAVPEVIGGRTMVPVRPIVEALGGAAGYDGEEILCEMEDVTLTFTVGSRQVKVETADGGDGTVDMDCAPYIKGGRTYVPVRFIGEALGCVVVWDDEYQTAVLNDPETVVAGIDKDFTLLNRVLASAAAPVEEGKNYRLDVQCDVTATAFDTLNGNTTYQGSVSSEVLMNSEAVNGTYTITMSDTVLDKLLEYLVGYSWDEEEYAEDVAMLRRILGNLKGIEVVETREGLYWAHIPVLDKMTGEENVWFGLNVDPDRIEAEFAGMQAFTVGQLIPTVVYSSSVVEAWSEMMDTVERLKAVAGDDCFVTTGGTSTLTLDMDKLDPDGGLGLKYELKECALTLKVDSQGRATLSCAVQTAEGRQPGMRLTVEAALSGAQVSLTANVHIANVGEVKMTLTTQRQVTNEAPVSEPPEGASIVDAAELLEGLVRDGYSNGQ